MINELVILYDLINNYSLFIVKFTKYIFSYW
jgi:hypothetical protein